MKLSTGRKTLWLIGWRYLWRHPWQSTLMVVGIMLGVAVMVAVDLANASAGRAFELSTEAVAGRATHQVSGGPNGVAEQVYAQLRRGDAPADPPALAPVISEYVYSPQLGEQPLMLLGVDPFAEAPFRDYLGTGLGGNPAGVAGRQALDLAAFLTRPGAVLISQGLAECYGLQAGQAITLELSAGTRQAWIAGLVQAQDELARRGLEGLILADISTAQELTGRVGRLDRIDVILPGCAAEPDSGEACALERWLAARLPAGVTLARVAARAGAVAQMTSAFRVNLTALSLLALLVGMFLIYNTITFSVVQRRPLFGTLRCLGATRQEVFGLVLSEALIVGVLGALLGLGLGVLMGQGAVRLVTQTINDLFFVVSVRGIQAPVSSLVKGFVIGVLATLATAGPPAWEAASVPPRLALSRSGLESKAQRALWVAAWAGLGLLALGAGLLLAPDASFLRAALRRYDLVVSFAGTFAAVVGCALLVPAAVKWLMRQATPWMGRLLGTLGRMAPRGVSAALSRTAIAVMALMVAVSVTIGVSLMVSSFRRTVITWLGEMLQGDIYVSVPSISPSAPSAPLDPRALQVVRTQPGAAGTIVLRMAEVDSPLGPVSVAATDNARVGFERVFLAQELPVEQIWPAMLAGGVLVSEPLANRFDLPRHGGQVTLETANGPQALRVLGVYYDYASTTGTVTLALPVYQELWDDTSLSGVALLLEPGLDADAVVQDLQARLRPVQRLGVVANAALRREVLVIFDRTFAITGALQMLATIVAFIGVLSALLSLELERQRELGILRAVGMTGRQLWGLVLLETGLMGAAAGLLAMPTGYLLSLILIYVINRRSFGWTLQMQLDAAPFAQALGVALAAALLAGLYPAWRMARMVASEALRGE